MNALKLFAFDDERIDPIYDALQRIHKQTGTRIGITLTGGPTELEAGTGIIVDCTFAAPGWPRLSNENTTVRMKGRAEILDGVLSHARGCLAKGGYDIILLDNTLASPTRDQRDYGVTELLPLARKGSPDALIAIITGFPMIADERTETLEKAFSGDARADMWLPKTAESLCDTLCSVILLVTRLTESRREAAALRRQLESALSHDGNIVGQSRRLKNVLVLAKKASTSDSSVILEGESGTGKENVAHHIHLNSGRRAKPFVPLNCGAVAQTHMEDDLFGHEQGAFANAIRKRAGLFELADGGTVLLDEIGEMPLELQTRLLRVLEEGELMRVGGMKPVKVNVRVIAATNRDLDQMVQNGTFRKDLFYRLNVIRIRLPSLAERREDIPLLVMHFVDMYAKKVGRTITSVATPAMEAMRRYGWPGNVRELENCIERAAVMGEGDTVQLADLPPEIINATSPNATQGIGSASMRGADARDWLEKRLDVWDEVCQQMEGEKVGLQGDKFAVAVKKVNSRLGGTASSITQFLNEHWAAIIELLRIRPAKYSALRERGEIVARCEKASQRASKVSKV
jgi:DNA-binding NtrC family response regulator